MASSSRKEMAARRRGSNRGPAQPSAPNGASGTAPKNRRRVRREAGAWIVLGAAALDMVGSACNVVSATPVNPDDAYAGCIDVSGIGVTVTADADGTTKTITIDEYLDKAIEEGLGQTRRDVVRENRILICSTLEDKSIPVTVEAYNRKTGEVKIPGRRATTTGHTFHVDANVPSISSVCRMVNGVRNYTTEDGKKYQIDPMDGSFGMFKTCTSPAGSGKSTTATLR